MKKVNIFRVNDITKKRGLERLSEKDDLYKHILEYNKEGSLYIYRCPNCNIPMVVWHRITDYHPYFDFTKGKFYECTNKHCRHNTIYFVEDRR